MNEDEKKKKKALLKPCVGCSAKNPSHSGCWKIVENYPWKKSGYYWI
jgi:hypothetical protein